MKISKRDRKPGPCCTSEFSFSLTNLIQISPALFHQHDSMLPLIRRTCAAGVSLAPPSNTLLLKARDRRSGWTTVPGLVTPAATPPAAHASPAPCRYAHRRRTRSCKQIWFEFAAYDLSVPTNLHSFANISLICFVSVSVY